MDWWIVATLIFSVLLIPTAYAGYIGAPWAPTRMTAVRTAFDDIGISNKDTVVDLGAGDGAIVKEAAMRGAKSVGYELSPIMWFIARIRTVSQVNATILLKNFYRAKLPHDTTLVFLFLMPNHMNRVGEYLAKQKIDDSTLVLSYAFPFRGVQTLTSYREKNCAPLYLYELSTLRFHFDNTNA